ncbi:MAG: DUF262 domain-containing protein [Bacteroidetes bacterium]|nr:DUF262 domain-containing protein [Bacteroidota bacterium]
MAELNVSRKTIKQTLIDTLKSCKNNRFIIPEYQRPYSWDIEKCDILWNDVKSFFIDNQENKEEYFLGTIVSCVDNENIAIIDGQQRITSLFLLFRAFYSKLELQHKTMPEDKQILGLMNQIAPCIWDVNQYSSEVEDKSTFHIRSKVATATDNEIFHSILETGNTTEDKSNYSKNYNYFVEQYNLFSQENPSCWKDLCLCFLNRCIVLPIECSDLDSALTIFSTLNDRGMPLSDSDIFKAELYRLQSNDETKKEFTSQWLSLSETLNTVGLTLNDIFRYYTHVIRATNKDKSKEVGLRKFYSANRYEKFKNKDIMNNLCQLADFWQKILSFNNEICSLETKQMIHCLLCYPNEYWKYPTSVFFFKNTKTLKEKLPDFLKNILSYLFVKFVDRQTVNAIKDPIFQACIDVSNNGELKLTHTIIDFKNKMDNLSTSKISKPMILLYSYLFDKEQELIPLDFQIEHIFPQKWDNNYFTWSNEDANLYINMFGNKITFERKLNIQASNNFFSKKQDSYKKSTISNVKSLCENKFWDKQSIIDRNNTFIKMIESFFIENLKPYESKEKLIFEIYGGNESFKLFEIVTSNITNYKMQYNNSEKTYRSIKEALECIDKGLLKYGTKLFISEEINKILIKNEKSNL